MTYLRCRAHSFICPIETFFPLFKNQALAETQRLRVTNLASAILSVYIDSASDLPQARSQSKPDPFAIVRY